MKPVQLLNYKRGLGWMQTRTSFIFLGVSKRIAKSNLRAHIKVVPQVLNHPIMELSNHCRLFNLRHGGTKVGAAVIAFIQVIQ